MDIMHSLLGNKNFTVYQCSVVFVLLESVNTLVSKCMFSVSKYIMLLPSGQGKTAGYGSSSSNEYLP